MHIFYGILLVYEDTVEDASTEHAENETSVADMPGLEKIGNSTSALKLDAFELEEFKSSKVHFLWDP